MNHGQCRTRCARFPSHFDYCLCGGPEPDGDTVTFFPDSLDLVRALKRFSGRAPEITDGHINARYEGIDALETHFQGTHQDVGFANAARELNLALLGFTNVRFFPDLPNVVQSVDRGR